MSFRAVAPTEVPELGIGLIGYEFMGRAHANAYRKIPYTFWPPPVRPRLVAVCGRTERRVAEAARRYGFEGYYTDWRALVADDRIGLVDNCAWHDAHAEPAIEAAWVCAGRKNQLAFEINGAKGSIAWDLEDLNRLHVYLEDADKVAGTRGFEDVLVTEAHHPYHQVWWPFGHILGWEHLHVNLIHHLLRAVASGEPVEPCGATFEDGYRAAVVTEAILESSRSGRRVGVAYG